jgi:glycosyltransferase involved in cell wall biosynthesis
MRQSLAAEGAAARVEAAGDVPTLCVVMPVHNEESCIEGVLDSWRAVLRRLDLRYQILVIDDGSRDSTGARLDAVAVLDSAVEVVHQAQSGHGPAILRGYRMAVGRAEWVFQVDSDRELEAAEFARFWPPRAGEDFVFGQRINRRQRLSRWIVSAGSRLTQRLLFGRGGPLDPNVPFRLMRARALAPLLEDIPPRTFAPNLIVSGRLARRALGVRNLPVAIQPRAGGHTTLRRWKLARVAWRALRETVTLARAETRPRR